MQVRYVYKLQMRLLNEDFTSLRVFFLCPCGELTGTSGLFVAFLFYSALGLKCAEF